MITIRELQKFYLQGESEIRVLNGIDLHVESGETLAVVGPSGSGKTTLLSILAGLEQPSKGVVSVDGRDLTIMSEAALGEFRGRSLGIVFQQFHLLPNLNALENVSLPLDIQGVRNAEQRAVEALRSVGLEQRMAHLPSELSGGECQRVAIARALVVQPRVLLADEPSGNLDVQTGTQVMDLLFDLVIKNGTTLVLVTHNREHALRCQRQIELKGGRLVAS